MSQILLDRLDQTAAEVRSVAWRTTAQLTAAVAVGAASLLVLVDWAGRFSDPGLRWLFTALLLIASAAAAFFAWRRNQPHDATRLGVAQRVQEARPELGSRLASAVEFADGEADDPTAGSAELRRAVVLDIASEAADLPLKAVVDRAPLKRSLRWLAAACLAFVALGVINSGALATGLWRLAFPWADSPWPRTVALRVIDPPTVLARGSDFEAIAVNDLGPIPEDTRIEYRLAADDESKARSESVAAQLVGDQAIASRTRMQRSFQYRFVGGDDQTMSWIDLEVIDPPIAQQMSITITPPAYSGLPESSTSGSLQMLVGSQMTLAGVANEPLVSAKLLLPGEEPVALRTEQSQFQADEAISVQTATQGEYTLELAGASGVVGRIGPQQYQALADEPPQVEWGSTSDDFIVPSTGLVPIAGMASDELAIQNIGIEWKSLADQAQAASLTIDDRGDQPPSRDSLTGDVSAPIEYQWDLEPLELSPGEELEVTLFASDYQPAIGRTSTTRRVAIVTPQEFLQRLAEKQSRLLGQVQQALTTQRDAATATDDLEADTRDSVDRTRLDRLSSIDYQQRDATMTIADPTTGALVTAEKLLGELRRSRMDAPDLDAQLRTASSLLKEAGQASMPAARSELADARRAGQRAVAGEQAALADFGQRLGAARERQAEAIETLEQVVELLTSWADYQRFASEAAALEELQRELSRQAQRLATAIAAGQAPLTEQADREKLITRQAEATRRFDKLAQAMRNLLQKPSEDDQTTQAIESIEDALAEADDADLAGKLRESGRRLARGQLGSASRTQQQSAETLRSMVEALRRRTTTDPSELVERLRQEQQTLAELQANVDRLARQPNTRQTESARQEAAERAERQSRRLDRLTASEAADSTERGAEQTAGDRPEQLADAQQAFDRAQDQIEQRIEQIEEEQAKRLLELLKEKIGGYIQRQNQVLDSTLELANQPPEQIDTRAQKLASDELELTEELSGYANNLARRAVFELALRRVAEQTGEAGERLDVGQVDRLTQRIENQALAGLRRVEEVLQQTPPEQDPAEQPPGGGGQGGGSAPPPPSPIDVAELKMLRLMQLELLDETDAYEADTAAFRRQGEPIPPEWPQKGRNLAKRQSRLAELALELAERNNDPEAAPESPE